MGIDRPDDNVPSDDHSDPPPNRPPAETRYRQDYYTDLRATTAAQERTEPSARSEPEARAKPAEPSENGQQAPPRPRWEETAELSRWMWTEYKRRWPAEERPPVDKPDDAPGSWHGDG